MLAVVMAAAISAPVAAAAEAEVTVGSPDNVPLRNKQNEPAVAMHPLNENFLAAGANDNIDIAPCGTAEATLAAPCPFTSGVSVTGVQFSFDGGLSWVQPTYTGWSARDGTPGFGPIGTLPWYFEEGIVADGDPAVAFGPKPGANGFSWANGVRTYYATLTSVFPPAGASPTDADSPHRRALHRAQFRDPAAEVPFKGFEAIAVSRIDDISPAQVQDKNAWFRPVIASKQSTTTFSDKEQIWADNVATSPHFGNAYVCYAAFRSVPGAAAPLFVATSHDGGDTWANKQVTAAHNVPPTLWGQSGCTIRTDSDGVVYVFYQQFESPFTFLPPRGSHFVVKSFDGGLSWERPQFVQRITDPCFFVDPVIFRCVMDGIAGARNDLSGSPNVDIANGAPFGLGATNLIVNTWVDARAGLNNEQVLLNWSSDGANTWSAPQVVSTTGDRGYYTAPALSPDGAELYLVYNAFLAPFQTTTDNARPLIGVVRRATVGPSGPSGWATLHRSPPGDARAASQNNLQAEFLGDYVYADASNNYGVAVWNDVRQGANCAAIDAWREDLQDGTAAATPQPQTVCPPLFGNTDIWSFSNR